MSKQTIRALIFACVVLLSVSACNQPPSVYETPVLQTGYWQASITLPGGDIETGIEISRAGEIYQASLVNGQERVRINDVSFLGGELLLRFPAFNNEIRAILIDGKLLGERTIVRRCGKTQVMPVSAMPGNERNQ